MRASVLWCCCNKRNGVLSFGGDQIDCNGSGWNVFAGGDSPHPENIQAVKECQKAGIKVCACTGRSFNRAKDIIAQAGFDQFCVVNNGASIVDWRTGQHRYRNRF